MKQAVILAGGMGTRLRARLGDLPKPMIPIGGRPLLEHQVELARRHGFDDIVLFVCYRPDLIESHLGDGSRFGVRLRYVLEKEPLGTAGALLAGWDALAESFLVLYGDTMVNVDLTRFREAHAAHRADVTLLLHPNNHPFDSDLVECDDAGWVTRFHNRPHPPGAWFQNRVNAGLYALNREALEPFRAQVARLEKGRVLDFGRDLFPEMLGQGRRLLGYDSPEYIKDIGTPERYDKVCGEYASGVIERSSLSTPAPAVFVDRDGTINRDGDGVRSLEALELLPGAAEGIQALNRAGLRVVVVTNQPVVAKGFVTEAELRVIHNKLESLLGLEHAYVDRIYYCPHHPEKGFPGERPELKIECDCRKPRPGMLLRAARELNLDLSRSWMIGDTTVDLSCARNAGVKPVLVRTGYGGQDGRFHVQPDFTFDNLAEAARFIVGQMSPSPSTTTP